MWTCPSCGEQLEEQFDTCWKCGTSVDGAKPEEFAPEKPARNDEGHTPDPEDADLTAEKMLRQILTITTEQQKVLGEIKWKVGCLFVYMVVGIALGAFLALLSLPR